MKGKTRSLQFQYREYLQDNEQIPLNITINGYKVLKQLGQGGFGKIYLAQNEKNQKIALKIIDLMKIKEQKNPKIRQIKERLIINEPKCMMECHSPNILKCHEILQNQQLKIFVLEYCNGKTLQEYLDVKMKLKEEEAVKIIRQIINGIAELHKNKIIHRDLKSQNIMEHEGQYKIIDLGFSKKMEYINDREQVKGTILGTFTTMAPEVISKKQYGLKADIWSLGVIFFQMVFGIHLYDTLNARQRQREIQQKKYFNENEPLNYKGTLVSTEANNFLYRTLEVNTQKRMDWKQLLQHPLIRIKQNEPIGDRFLIRPTIEQPMVSKDLQIERIRQDSICIRMTEQSQKEEKKQNQNQNKEFKQGQQKKQKIQVIKNQKKRRFNLQIKPQKTTKNQKQQKPKKQYKNKLQIQNMKGQQLQQTKDSEQFHWCKQGHLECLKTQFIFYQLIVPIQTDQLLDQSQRENIQFLFLLIARCFNNMSPIKFKLQNQRFKTHVGIKNLFQQVKPLYEKVSKKFNEYSAKLTEKQNQFGSKLKDVLRKRFSFWGKKQYDNQSRFIAGVQIIDKNNPFKITRESQLNLKEKEEKKDKEIEQQQNQLYGDYQKIDQIRFTYNNYIPKIRQVIQKRSTLAGKNIISYLGYYDKIIQVSLEDLGKQSYSDFVKRTVL